MSRSWSRVLSLVVSVVIAGTPAFSAASSPGDSVYVGRNGSQYHRADCPRLRFGEAMARDEALKHLSPCPLCKPDQAVATPAASAPVAAPPIVAEKPVPAKVEMAPKPTPAVSHPKPPRRNSGRGSAPVVGAVVGGIVGSLVGALVGGASASALDSGGEDSGQLGYVAGWVGGAVLGAMGGYALCGGREQVDEAFLKEQERFRSSHLGTQARLAESRP